MSMRGQISIILFCLFASISWSQNSPARLRSVFATAIDSMIRSQGLDPLSTAIIADTVNRPSIEERHSKDPSAMVYINGRTFAVVGSGNQQIINISGTVVSLKPPKNPEVFTISRRFTHGVVAVADADEGFWDSVLQPTLVTLGAVAIIALFFLIRS